MAERKISECKNRHYFVGDACPWCMKPAIRHHPFYSGDCVGCGSLCADGQYCCTSKNPMSEQDFDEILHSRKGI